MSTFQGPAGGDAPGNAVTAPLYVTDAPARLAAWQHGTGLPPGETLDLSRADTRGVLRKRTRAEGLAVTAVVAGLDERAAHTLAGAWAAASVRLVVWRGLAPSCDLDSLLARLEAGGLRPCNALEAAPDGADILLARDVEPAAALAALARVASLTASWTRAEAATGLRVAVAGHEWRWADGLAGSTPVQPAWAEDEDALRRAAPDVVVVDRSTQRSGGLGPAVEAARRAGAVLLAAGGSNGWPVDGVLEGLEPFNPLELNPVGARPARAAVEVVEPSGAAEAGGGTAHLLAADLLRRCATGEPLICPRLPGAVAALLGEPLAGLLSETPAEAVADETLRERHSVRVRRAALRSHGVAERWRGLAAQFGLATAPRRTVSVLLATRREQFLEHALEQLAKQDYRPLEIVAVLHGIDDHERWRSHAAERLDANLTVVPVDAAASLGAALQAGVQAASGDVITKMDDDDWYGAEHVADLLLALEYSGATLVGKGAEFYHFVDDDVTLRRVNDRPEWPSRLVSGNTLTLRRDDLLAVGGWQDTDRRVDRRLTYDVLRAAGTVYRTHGFGHVVQRHAHGHTWQTSADELRRGSVWEAPGCRLDIADA